MVCAFIVGGILIALLSFLAERAPRSLKGIIIAFPSTITVSFAFIAFTVGSQTLIDILPGVYYSLLGTILFTFAFSSAAKWFSGKTPERKWPILFTTHYRELYMDFSPAPIIETSPKDNHCTPLSRRRNHLSATVLLALCESFS